MTDVLEGHGVFCYPHITVHNTSIELPYQAPTKEIRRKIKLNYELPSLQILVTDDGFFGVLSDESSTRKFLEIVFATMLIYKNIPAEQFSVHDMIQFKWEKGSDEIEIPQFLPTPRNHIAFERDVKETFFRLKKFKRTLVTEQDLRSILNTSYEYSKNYELSNELILLAQGWSLFSNDSLNATFLYGWMLIETLLDKMWRHYIATLQRTSDEKDDLKSHRNWSAYQQIEAMSFIGKMNDKTRKLLTYLRKKRNAIIHDMYQVTREESQNCLETAFRIIRNQLESRDPFYSVPD